VENTFAEFAEESFIKELEKTMIPIYKIVKISKPHCSICKERLLGNGSRVLPYRCSCGEWKVDIKTGEYNLINNK